MPKITGPPTSKYNGAKMKMRAEVDEVWMYMLSPYASRVNASISTAAMQPAPAAKGLNRAVNRLSAKNAI